jgi:hypothetical protein
MDYVERNVVEPKGIVQVHRDYWFWCVDGDPKRALFYTGGRRGYGHPQCNSSQTTAQRVGESLKHDTRAQLVQIPLAFVPWEY